MSVIRRAIRDAARACGFEVWRIGSPAPWKYSLADRLRERRITTVLDVGANSGQFAKMLRSSGFDGQIFSFEPMTAAFVQLQSAADRDPKWTAFRCALGDRVETRQLNLAGNSVSSSLLDVTSHALEAEPDAAAVGVELVRVETLDSILPGLDADPARTLLKLDVQGFERQVLSGARGAMSFLPAVVTECSLTPVYEGEWLFSDAVGHFLAAGFRLEHLEPVFKNASTGEILQVDAHFWRPL